MLSVIVGKSLLAAAAGSNFEAVAAADIIGVENAEFPQRQGAFR
jgi:hypothetical protein